MTRWKKELVTVVDGTGQEMIAVQCRSGWGTHRTHRGTHNAILKTHIMRKAWYRFRPGQVESESLTKSIETMRAEVLRTGRFGRAFLGKKHDRVASIREMVAKLKSNSDTIPLPG